MTPPLDPRTPGALRFAEMDTEIRSPVPPLADSRLGERRSRRWPWLLATLAVVLAIFAAVGMAWIANIEPLGPGSTTFGPSSIHVSTPSPGPRIAARFVDALGASGTVIRIPVTPGMRFTYQVTIRNEGSVPVEIIDVRSGSTPGQITRHIVAAQPDTLGGALKNIEPFRPFTLSPGHEAGLVIEVIVADDACVTEPGTTFSWWLEPVSFRVFGFPWFERFQDVETRTEIALVGHGPGC